MIGPMKKTTGKIVSPFDWRRYTATGAEPVAADRRAKPASRAKVLTVEERLERILATRWGSPYSKPGSA
jgi:hypothetical protein